MAVASASAEAIDPASPMDRSVSKFPSDVASDSSSSRDISFAETPDRSYPSTSSPNPSKDAENQVPVQFSFVFSNYSDIWMMTSVWISEIRIKEKE